MKIFKKNRIFEKYDLIMDNTFYINREDDYPIICEKKKWKVGWFIFLK